MVGGMDPVVGGVVMVKVVPTVKVGPVGGMVCGTGTPVGGIIPVGPVLGTKPVGSVVPVGMVPYGIFIVGGTGRVHMHVGHTVGGQKNGMVVVVMGTGSI